MCDHDDAPASQATVAANRAFLEASPMDWASETDRDFAIRGLIAKAPNLVIRDSADRIVWDGAAYDRFLHGDAPDTVNPSLWRHAVLNNIRGLFKVTDGIYQVRGHSLANITFIEAETGLIVIDPNNTVEVARFALDLYSEHIGERPVIAVIYSHSHSDHWGGVKGVTSADDVAAGRCRVIASQDFVAFTTRESLTTGEGTNSRNAYMYGEVLPVHARGQVDTGLGKAAERGSITYIAPTDIVSDPGATMTIDGVELVFQYAPGEAPTGLHVYSPRHKVLHVADNCYACLHNVYTIRGALPRHAMQWRDSVHRALAFDETEILVGGHNWPRFGRGVVRDYLGKQRDALKYMHDQTIRLIHHGCTPGEIADRVTLPPALAREWYLRGYYGAVKHNVRGIYAYYLGWYDGNPANLDPLPPRETARRMIAYMGGVAAVLERASRDLADGDYRWVAQVLDQVMWLEPDNQEARALAAEAHRQMGYQAENATWRNAYLTASQELTNGLPQGIDGARAYDDFIANIATASLFDFLALRLNGPACGETRITANWHITDTNERFLMVIDNAVLNAFAGEACDAADFSVALDRAACMRLTLEAMEPDEALRLVQLTPAKETAAFTRMLTLFDRFPSWFPIASHDRKPLET